MKKFLELFNPTKKQILLSDKIDNIENKISVDYHGILDDNKKKKIDTFVSVISSWFLIQFENELNSKKMNVKENKIVDLMDRDIYSLLDVFDINSISNIMNNNIKIDKHLYNCFENDHNFKNKVYECALYKVLQAKKNVEYGLIFCKTFDLNLGLAMQYLPDDLDNNIDLIQKYLNNGGNPNIDYYPNGLNIKRDEIIEVKKLESKISELNKNKILIKVKG